MAAAETTTTTVPKKKYGVVDLEDLERWRDGPYSFVRLFGEEDEEWVVYEAARKGHYPTLADGLSGVILTGSHYNLSSPDTARLPWVVAMVEYIRAALLPADGADDVTRPRIVGTCFGHQLLAHALGGAVAPNPGGVFVLKAEDIAPTAAFAALPYAAGIIRGAGAVADTTDEGWLEPGSPAASAAPAVPALRIIVSHGDCVAALPPGAALLASSPSCAHEVFLAGSNALGMQCHPEFDVECVKSRIWPVVVEERERLSPAEAAASLASFDLPRHSWAMRVIMRRFLKRQHPPVAAATAAAADA